MRQKGILTLTNPTSDVSFSITALRVYNIFASVQHCSKVTSFPTTILQGSTATMVFTAESGYKMPSTAPTISTATVVSWTVSTTSTTDDTGTLILSNPTGDVSFTVTGEAIQSNYVGRISSSPAGVIYVKINGTVSLSNYDLITSGYEDISIPQGSYFTMSDGLNDPGVWDIWFNSTYSRNITGTPATQDGTNMITATPLANDWRLDFNTNF